MFDLILFNFFLLLFQFNQICSISVTILYFTSFHCFPDCADDFSFVYLFLYYTFLYMKKIGKQYIVKIISGKQLFHLVYLLMVIKKVVHIIIENMNSISSILVEWKLFLKIFVNFLCGIFCGHKYLNLEEEYIFV